MASSSSSISPLLLATWLLGAVIVWIFIFPFLKGVCKGSVKNQNLRRILVSALLAIPIGLFFADKFGKKSQPTAPPATSVPPGTAPTFSQQATAPMLTPGMPTPFSLPPSTVPVPSQGSQGSQSGFVTVPQEAYEAFLASLGRK